MDFFDNKLTPSRVACRDQWQQFADDHAAEIARHVPGLAIWNIMMSSAVEERRAFIAEIPWLIDCEWETTEDGSICFPASMIDKVQEWRERFPQFVSPDGDIVASVLGLSVALKLSVHQRFLNGSGGFCVSNVALPGNYFAVLFLSQSHPAFSILHEHGHALQFHLYPQTPENYKELYADSFAITTTQSNNGGWKLGYNDFFEMAFDRTMGIGREGAATYPFIVCADHLARAFLAREKQSGLSPLEIIEFVHEALQHPEIAERLALWPQTVAHVQEKIKSGLRSRDAVNSLADAPHLKLMHEMFEGMFNAHNIPGHPLARAPGDVVDAEVARLRALHPPKPRNIPSWAIAEAAALQAQR